jgi:glyoxylase-like metal-dependent hydrolase (beta-lactamase superfamily II)
MVLDYSRWRTLDAGDDDDTRVVRVRGGAVPPAPPLQATDRLFFKQLLPGEDIALVKDSTSETDQEIFNMAKDMANYIYLIGDAATKECVVVDGAWDIPGIVEHVTSAGYRLTGAVCTHYHLDHVGGPGSMYGLNDRCTITGVHDLVRVHGAPMNAHRSEISTIAKQCSLRKDELLAFDDNSRITVGKNVAIDVLHTPGHTCGSCCMRVRLRDEVGDADAAAAAAAAAAEPFGFDHGLLSGDTVFVGSCGRLDGPDSDKLAMFGSLKRLAAELPRSITVFPGHAYGPPTTTIENEVMNGMLKPFTQAKWCQMFSITDPTLLEPSLRAEREAEAQQRARGGPVLKRLRGLPTQVGAHRRATTTPRCNHLCATTVQVPCKYRASTVQPHCTPP